MSELTVTKIPAVNVIVLKQKDGRDFFISTKDSIIISPSILKFLVTNDMISPKLLEGVLEEYYTYKGD